MPLPVSVRAELLSPAGDWEALRAAVANGADAVYFGLSDFNARHRAANFTLEELPQVMRYLHDRNVRGYVTCNTLIFSDELPAIAEYITALARAGADAVIVQDLGLVGLIRRLAPGLTVHGSTQMTLTEPGGIEFVRRLGVERVILARELSVREIGKIAEQTTVPLEVFIHGALCVAYSGQCLTSESLGGRSANRGQCAQACRLPYDLMVDGAVRPLGDQAYLLSPQDLAAPDLVQDLVRLGVSCLKIEGRLKSAQYVAATTQVYRTALDAALAESPFTVSRRQELDLAQSFSRGLSHGFLDGVNHQVLVQGRFPKNRGVRIGTVAGRTSRGIVLQLESALTGGAIEEVVKGGDGVVFDAGHPDQDEQGGRLFGVYPVRAGRWELVFGEGDVDLTAVEIGNLVWKTDDPALRKRMEQSYNRDLTPHRAALNIDVRAAVGERLRVTFTDDAGRKVEVESPEPLATAVNRPLTAALLREQFSRLGDTPFTLGQLTLHDAQGPLGEDATVPVMAPKSVLNELRRVGVAQLLDVRKLADHCGPVDPGGLETLREAATASLVRRLEARPTTGPGRGAPPGQAVMTVLVRTPDQLRVVLDWEPVDGLPRPETIYCDFEDIRRYEAAVATAKAAEMPIALATLRVIKPEETGLLRQIAAYEPDAVLVRNLAAVRYYEEKHPELRLLGDYALNVSNELTAALFAEQNLVRVVPSYDLNWQQLRAMVGRVPAEFFEIVLHQHMPMFHMEHCVFAHVLSNGKDHRDCGRPCDLHKVELRDRMGEPHPLVADAGCRNTVFNAHPQSAAEYVPRMRELGLSCFRVELLREQPGEIPALLNRYARVVAGLEEGRAAWTGLRVLNQLGVTRGTLDFS